MMTYSSGILGSDDESLYDTGALPVSFPIESYFYEHTTEPSLVSMKRVTHAY